MKKVKNNIIAEGEVTGHYHKVVKGGEVFESENGIKFIKAPEDFEVEHQEHKKIKWKKGFIETGIRQEYDHIEDQLRNVAD